MGTINEMTYSEWKSDFVAWHTQRNMELANAKSSMDMVSEVQSRFAHADAETKVWMIQLFREWQESGDEFQKYDSRFMLKQIDQERELNS
jgi:hypothetical protein